MLSIIENKNIINKDSLNPNSCNIMPDFANKKILQLTDKVHELMTELQTIKSSASDDYASILYYKNTIFLYFLIFLINILENKNSTEIKQMTDKYNLSNKKICSYRNQIIQLKNELKITRNVRKVFNGHYFVNSISFLLIYLRDNVKYRHYLMKLEIQQ